MRLQPLCILCVLRAFVVQNSVPLCLSAFARDYLVRHCRNASIVDCKSAGSGASNVIRSPVVG